MLVSGTLAASVSSVWANNDKAEEQHQLATQSTKITQKSTKKDNKDAKKIKPMSLMTLDTDAPANNPNSLMRAHVGQTGFTSVDPYSGSMIFHIPIVNIPENDSLNLYFSLNSMPSCSLQGFS